MRTSLQTILMRCIIFFTLAMLAAACGQTNQPATPNQAATQVAAAAIPTKIPAIATGTLVSTPAPTINWKTYRNETYKFSFEYPAVYDDPSLKGACGLKESGSGISLGHQIHLDFLSAGGAGLDDYTKNFILQKGWKADTQENKVMSGLEAVTIQYRFGGSNRFGTFTLAKSGEQIFAFSFSAGSFCEFPNSQASEGNTYAHILDSFKLDK